MCSMIAVYVYIDEKLTPRDLSTDNIVLKCISHRSAAGHYVKSILLYVDIVRQTGCSYLLTRIDKFLQGARQWIYSLDTYLKIFLIYSLKDRNTNISPNRLKKEALDFQNMNKYSENEVLFNFKSSNEILTYDIVS